MPPAVAEVVLELVALVLQRVERFVLDPPARPPGAHQLHRVPSVHPQVRDPREALLPAVRPPFPAFEEVHLEVHVRVVQRRPVRPPEAMLHALRVRRLPALRARLRAGRRNRRLQLVHPREQRLVVARLRPQHEAHVQLLQQTDVRPVRRQTVLHHRQRQVRMLPPKLPQQALRRVPLAVVLPLPVRLADRLRRNHRQNLPPLRVYKHRAQRLVVVRLRPVPVRSFTQQCPQCTVGDEKCPVPSTDSRCRTPSHSNSLRTPPRGSPTASAPATPPGSATRSKQRRISASIPSIDRSFRNLASRPILGALSVDSLQVSLRFQRKVHEKLFSSATRPRKLAGIARATVH